MQPTVTLPIGVHDIRLVVLDGQRQGDDAHVQVSVSSPPVGVRALKASASVIEPPDGIRRDVTVTEDIVSACRSATCRLVSVSSDAGKDSGKLEGDVKRIDDDKFKKDDKDHDDQSTSFAPPP